MGDLNIDRRMVSKWILWFALDAPGSGYGLVVSIRCTWFRLWSGGEHFVNRVIAVEILPNVGMSW